MPVDTFARRFKAQTGMAPYAYVIDRRVRRAQSLLRGSALPMLVGMEGMAAAQRLAL
ncbi:hypothetical protein CBM2615_A170021 [Cupriavidus taiwanensis]|uniref:HTH araC/xylS-type domain-containing protein n=1 Tax=Cupriavidus taiwanensis TaxID=164546 RepID=A0A375DYD3_9BURK|nr:hypothetical protein [Cupriavidus taiwanensis]SOZ50749.1 hypothetical protein CBM2615_A170021 [Cupriavidus taiwanensis]SOZ52255.1 hypothetical protein CBM2614_A160021 [Cupriavidus taiwanensis]SOZ54800.1 hypothetical protein CBM2613_A180021 [Cupriavidus taiwanensis]SPA04381.1 hypothetical protein CBM2625_A130021 [Cupriavidus taiwanensis]